MKKRTKKPRPLWLYISGPMAERPGHNREAFAAVRAALLAAGHIVFNPAAKAECHDRWHSHDSPAEWARRTDSLRARGLSQFERRGWLRDDIWALSLCDGIVMLDDWEDSTGARAEHAWAEAVGMRVHHWASADDRIVLVGTATTPSAAGTGRSPAKVARAPRKGGAR
jgi:hypothetical protein